MKSHKTIHCEPVHDHMLNSAQGQGQISHCNNPSTALHKWILNFHRKSLLEKKKNNIWKLIPSSSSALLCSQQPLTDVPYLI